MTHRNARLTPVTRAGLGVYSCVARYAASA